MGYKGLFLDDKNYGIGEVNNMFKNLVTSGIADIFTDGVPYNTTMFNGAIQIISHSGVVPSTVNSCKVAKVSEGNIKILKGLAYFENGTSIEIDNDGVDLQYTTGTKNYVYVKSDLTANKIEPFCTTEQPTGDIVMLAEIESTGVITDKRKYAKGKLPGYQSNSGTRLEVITEGMSFPTSSSPHVLKQIYYTPGEYRLMVAKYNDVSLTVYDIANDIANSVCARNTSGGTRYGRYTTTKTCYLHLVSDIVGIYGDYQENDDGMLFTFRRASSGITGSLSLGPVSITFY